jgi:hypothetical protein
MPGAHATPRRGSSSRSRLSPSLVSYGPTGGRPVPHRRAAGPAPPDCWWAMRARVKIAAGARPVGGRIGSACEQAISPGVAVVSVEEQLCEAARLLLVHSGRQLGAGRECRKHAIAAAGTARMTLIAALSPDGVAGSQSHPERGLMPRQHRAPAARILREEHLGRSRRVRAMSRPIAGAMCSGGRRTDRLDGYRPPIILRASSRVMPSARASHSASRLSSRRLLTGWALDNPPKL